MYIGHPANKGGSAPPGWVLVCFFYYHIIAIYHKYRKWVENDEYNARECKRKADRKVQRIKDKLYC